MDLLWVFEPELECTCDMADRFGALADPARDARQIEVERVVLHEHVAARDLVGARQLIGERRMIEREIRQEMIALTQPPVGYR